MSTANLTDISRPIATRVAPIGFLGAFLAASPVAGAFADRPLPLPTAPAAEAAAYYVANPLAALILAGMQVLSVACFAVFVAGIAPVLRAGGGTRLPSIGYVSAMTMVLSSVLSATGALIATTASADVVNALRLASFYTGGVANVATLGAFVFAASLVLGMLGKPTRWFGYVAGALAMLSVVSLGVYYASALLPIGRVLSMVWTVIAGVRLMRGTGGTK